MQFWPNELAGLEACIHALSYHAGAITGTGHMERSVGVMRWGGPKVGLAGGLMWEWGREESMMALGLLLALATGWLR